MDKMLIRAFIFDCDGVIADSEMQKYIAWQNSLQRHYNLPYKLQDYIAVLGESCRSIYKKLNLPPEKYEHFREQLTTEFIHVAEQQNVVPIKKNLDFFHACLKARETHKIKVAIITCDSARATHKKLKGISGIDQLDALVTHDDLTQTDCPSHATDTKTYLYRETSKRLQIPIHQVIAVEDTQSGVTSAETAGCKVFAVPTDLSTHHEFDGAVLRVRSLSEIELHWFLDAPKAA